MVKTLVDIDTVACRITNGVDRYEDFQINILHGYHFATCQSLSCNVIYLTVAMITCTVVLLFHESFVMLIQINSAI